MKQYLEILKQTLNGEPKKPYRNREGQEVSDTVGIFAAIFRHKMSEGFPLVTTKKVLLSLVAIELEAFLKGITDKQWFQERNCHIWDEWCNPTKIPKGLTKEEKLEYMKNERCLGPIYGYQLRSYNKTYQPIPHAKLLNNHNPISVLNIGSLGDKKYNKTVPNWQKLRKSWQQMLRRCYCRNDKDYKNYGGRGVYVSDDWLIFSNYLRDIQLLKNWNKKLENWNKYSLDKDIGGGKYYSKETCEWISQYEQVRNSIQIDSYRCFNDNENRIYNSLECAEKDGFTRGCIIKCCNFSRKKHKSYFWERIKNTKNDFCSGFDQLKYIINGLENNPYDRRLYVSYWNQEQINLMSLPACHIAWNVVVYNGKLNLIWNQRSCDAALGIPFNIASYALLLKLLAKHARLEEGELVGTLNDCHIYTNQIEGVKEQLSRQPFSLPQVNIPDNCEAGFDIFKWDHTQLELLNYKHHPSIKYKLEV